MCLRSKLTYFKSYLRKKRMIYETTKTQIYYISSYSRSGVDDLDSSSPFFPDFHLPQTLRRTPSFISSIFSSVADLAIKCLAPADRKSWRWVSILSLLFICNACHVIPYFDIHGWKLLHTFSIKLVCRH